MNKNTFLISLLIFSGVIISPDVDAQLQDPSSWKSFVESSANSLSMDTFVIQSFEGTEKPSWNFEVLDGNVPVIVDASQLQILNQKGNKSLQLKGNCKIRFEWEKPAGYNQQTFAFYIAARNVSTNGSLKVQIASGTPYTIPAKELDFGQDHGKTQIKDRIVVNGNGEYMIITTENIGENGSFFIDYMTISGTIQRYSLFQGEGKWDETEKWTHRPVYRNRHALLQGDVDIKSDVKCKDLHLSNGSVSISSGSSLQNSQTYLYTPGSAIYTAGDWTMEQINVYKTFPEKGKWYFVSFPFDVYRKDIDPLFELKDEQTSLSDNYFYVLKYDGEKRSYSNSLGNWSVIPEKYPEDVPLFEKGLGYLVALDKDASTLQMLFSSQSGKKLVWNSLEYEKWFDVPLKNDQMQDEHHGWILCGNPFPSPLPVKNINKTGQLDGFVYYFDGTEYKSYSLNGDHVLPPFSAFFIKANASFTMRIKPPVDKPPGTYLPDHCSGTVPGDPRAVWNSSAPQDSGKKIDYEVRGNYLYFTDLPDSGEFVICNLSGKIVLNRAVSRGSSTVSLNLPKGVYILSVRIGKEETQEKFILY